MRRRGADVGNFLLAEKADGEAFTDDDGEVLVLFASSSWALVSHELREPLAAIKGSATTPLEEAAT